MLMLLYGFPHIYHFPVCKKDLSATLEMTVRENRYPQTFGHRPIYICGEAATTTLNPEP